MNDGPVFIGGLAFSGKTPLRIALSAHPRLELTRKTAMWTRFHGRFGDLSADRNLDRCLDVMLADPAIAALHPDRAQVRQAVRAGLDAGEAVNAGARELPAEMLLPLAQHMDREMTRLDEGRIGCGMARQAPQDQRRIDRQ